MYRPINIEIQLTRDEALILWRKVRGYEPISDALEQALKHCAEWGSHPPPHRALVVGFQHEKYEGLTGPEPHMSVPFEEEG